MPRTTPVIDHSEVVVMVKDHGEDAVKAVKDHGEDAVKAAKDHGEAAEVAKTE